MSPLKSKQLGFSALALVVLALAAAQGCSSSDDTQATPSGGTSSGGASGGHTGTTTTGGTGTGGHSGSGTAGSGTAGSSTAGSGGSTDMGMGGEGGAVDCDGPDGCYNCAPSTTEQFLNHCVEGGCQPAQDFHLPATLPALP